MQVIAVLSLAAASCGRTPEAPPEGPAAESPLVATGPAATVPAAAVATHQADTPIKPINMWAVPGFAPLEDEAGNRPGLQSALDAIVAQDPRLGVDITLMPERGQSGVDSLLASTASAAPAALPDIVMLPLDSLDAAAAQDLIQTLPDTVPPDRIQGSFPFARDASTSHYSDGDSDTYRAVPFAVDVGHAIARDEPVPESWEQAVEEGVVVVLPSGTVPDAAALIGSAYLSTDRESLELDAADVALAIEPLAGAATAEIATGSEGGESGRAAWNSFLLDETQSAVVSAGVFAPHQPNFPALTWGPLPAGDDPARPIGWGWAFVITTQDPERAAVAGEVIAWLTEPGGTGWVLDSDYLPAAQDGWEAAVTSGLNPAPSDDYVEFAADLLSEADGLTMLPGRWESWAEILERLLSGESAEDAAAAIASE